jgi:hypothetical protein
VQAHVLRLLFIHKVIINGKINTSKEELGAAIFVELD